jgi:AraC family transcriptional regulator
VILRYMPPIWDAAFRTRFYARWGRESSLISARTRRAEYGPFRQLLSVKAAWGGAEQYFVDGQRIAVDDDTFLILNAGRRYASAVESSDPVHSFSVFFRQGLMEDVKRGVVLPTEQLLDAPEERDTQTIEFGEHLREHDNLVTPVLRHIQRAVDGGATDDLWFEEQLHFLAQRMLRVHIRDIERRIREPTRRAAVRKELERRLGLAVNFMNTHYASPIGLDEIAGAARLSPHHFLRAFKAAHGLTPSAYLNRKRVRVALRLMQDSSWSLTRIAYHVGFGSRTTLYRHLRGAAPSPSADGERAKRREA